MQLHLASVLDLGAAQVVDSSSGAQDLSNAVAVLASLELVSADNLAEHGAQVSLGSVAAEDVAQSVLDGGGDEVVADQGNNVGGESLNVIQVPDRSGNSADSVDKASATVDIGHLVLCDNRVVCRHHHNELLPSKCRKIFCKLTFVCSPILTRMAIIYHTFQKCSSTFLQKV